MRSRTRWRSRLFTRLRVTAGPTDRATTKPIRRSWSPSTRARWTTRSGPPARRPRRTAVANPAASVRRWPRGSTPNRLIRRLRRPGGCDPCAGARRGCCARHGCASAVGSRASCDDAGCSAGTYACSRGLRSWSGQAQRLSVRRIGACPTEVLQPIDAGPTAQRYAERAARVKLSATAYRPVLDPPPSHAGRACGKRHADGSETCGQLVDPRVRRLLRFRPRVVARVCHTPGPDPLKPHVSGQFGPPWLSAPALVHNLWTNVWTCRRLGRRNDERGGLGWNSLPARRISHSCGRPSWRARRRRSGCGWQPASPSCTRRTPS